jgi:DNA-binding IclR family transcriptional regulator
MSASDVARLLEVNRSTALRLLGELEETGYVTRDAAKRFATVPSRFYALIVSHDDHADWSEVVDPILASLRDEFGEAAIMGVPANGTMVYLAFFPSVHIVAVRERLGTARPMHCSALGKAYLSALGPAALDLELGRLAYQGGTDRAPRGPMDLRERVDETRKRGYAIDRDETFEGGSCVAAPVRIAGALVGAMGLSGPSSRFSEMRIHEMGRRLVAVTRPLEGPTR